MSAREALAVLRIVQELTATLAKRADELRIDVQRDGDAAVVTVEAIGWAELDPAPRRARTRASARSRGRSSCDPATDSLTAEVRIPDSAN